MFKPTYLLAVFLSVFCIHPSPAEEHRIFRGVEPHIDVTYQGRDRLHAPEILRYRFITVDVKTLREKFFAAAQLDDIDTAQKFQIHLFPDVMITAKFASARLFSATLTPLSGESKLGGYAYFHISVDGFLTGSVSVAGHRYGIFNTDKLPYHVVVELDPSYEVYFE